MQIIHKILKISGNTGKWITEDSNSDTSPELAIGIQCKLKIDLRDEIKDDEMLYYKPIDFDTVNCDSYYVAFDSDYLSTTTPKLLKTSGISLVQKDNKVYLECELPNTNTTSLVNALKNSEKITLKGEIGGFKVDSDNIPQCVFAVQFSVVIRNRVYLGDTPPTEDEVLENDYPTRVEVLALINKLTLPQQGEQGEKGEQGIQGIQGIQGVQGEQGEQGKQGIQGEQGIQGANGLDGKDGEGLNYDVSGEISELHAYDEMPKGFKFASNNVDGEIIIYTKNSDELNDWCTPVKVNAGIDGINGKDGLNVQFIHPCEFKYDSGKTYFKIDMETYHAVDIANVYIDTVDGEEKLPFDSALGISKVVRKKKYTELTETQIEAGEQSQVIEDFLYLYFGSLVPQYDTGRVYFAQGVTNQEIVIPDTDDTDDTTENFYYGYVSGLSSINDLDDISDLTEKELTELTKFSVGSGSAGDMLVVLIPNDSDYAVTKFNGLNGDVAFDTAISGANGSNITINNIDYKLYGEFILTTGERFIYVN